MVTEMGAEGEVYSVPCIGNHNCMLYSSIRSYSHAETGVSIGSSTFHNILLIALAQFERYNLLLDVVHVLAE